MEMKYSKFHKYFTFIIVERKKYYITLSCLNVYKK